MSMLRTIPGTETNVTPESDVPTIPIDTMYQAVSYTHLTLPTNSRV